MVIMKKYFVFIYLILYFILNISFTASAADFSTGREGEIIRPLESALVKLVQEDITIHLDTKKTNFLFKTKVKNMGPGIEMFVGYPSEKMNNEGMTAQTFRDFCTYIDGRSVPIMETDSAQEEGLPKNPQYDKWFLWPLILDTGQVKEVTNNYWIQNSSDASGNTISGFILKPAKFWYGKPDKVTVRYVFDSFEPYVINSALPANFTFEGDQLVYNFDNVVPESDIKLSFNPNYEFQILDIPASEINAFWDAKNNKHYDNALKLISAYLNNNNNLTLETKLALKTQMGIVFMAKGDLNKAQTLLEEGLNNNLSLSAIYYHLAKIYASKNNIEELNKLYNKAISNHINPVVVRKIESYLPLPNPNSIPEIVQFNADDVSHITAEIFDKDANIEKISLEILTKESNNTKILSYREINISGQSYHYFVKEKFVLPVFIKNAYCRLCVIHGSGKNIEKVLPLSNRKSNLLSNKEIDDSTPISVVIAIVVLLLIFSRKTLFKLFNKQKG